MFPKSLETAANWLETEALDAFSFDVFDTFVLRRCSSPEGVYERAFQLAPIGPDHRHMSESFVQQRMIAELRARHRQWQASGAREVSIEAIYALFPLASFGVDPSQRAALVEAEFQAELDLCFLNRDLAELYAKARRRAGLKTGFISDTYWSAGHLRRLLAKLAPGLEIDFLYASCEHRHGKSDGLFPVFLQAEELAADKLAHIGDNPRADIAAAETAGVRALHYRLGNDALPGLFQREGNALQAILSQGGPRLRRLDRGLRTLRRLAEDGREHRPPDLAEDMPRIAGSEASLARITGRQVLGPLMVAFRNFAAARVAALRVPQPATEVLFLARDGYLPFQLWDRDAFGPAHYAELNRRVALVGGSARLDAVQGLFRAMRLVNEDGVLSVLKTTTPRITAFFADRPKNRATGSEFAAALPALIDEAEIGAIASAMRESLIDYLRALVAGFDACTDLVLVDLGYNGTIQRGLRDLLDLAGFAHMRLHGLYLATVDENFAELRSGDSAAGFIDDAVLASTAKRALLRNVAVLEQFCSAPVGSVFGYDGGRIVREEELRDPVQVALCEEVRGACLDFAGRYDRLVHRHGLDPLADGLEARIRATAILWRFLMMPRLGERELFGKLKQDVNLGSRAIVNMIDVDGIDLMLGTLPLDKMAEANEPPMWLTGGLAAISPVMGYAGAVAALGLVGDDLLADAYAGQLSALLVQDSEAERLPVGCAVTARGEIRLRLPVLRKHRGHRVALPLDPLFRHGLIRSAVWQEGEGAGETMANREIQTLPRTSFELFGGTCDGYRFVVTGKEGHLILRLPAFEAPVAVVTLTLDPLPAIDP